MSRFGKQQLHELYYYLKLNRSLAEELVRLFRAGKLVGALPISTGQEAPTGRRSWNRCGGSTKS